MRGSMRGRAFSVYRIINEYTCKCELDGQTHGKKKVADAADVLLTGLIKMRSYDCGKSGFQYNKR